MITEYYLTRKLTCFVGSISAAISSSVYVPPREESSGEERGFLSAIFKTRNRRIGESGNRGIGESGNRGIGESGNRGIGEAGKRGSGEAGNRGIGESGNGNGEREWGTGNGESLK